MTWANPSLAPEPHTPPMSVCAGTVMEPYLPAAWGVPGTEYDPNYGEMPIEDPLMVKADPNCPARPLHTYMAPLSLGNAPLRPPSPPPSNKGIDMRLAQPGTEESKPGYLTPLASYTAQTFWYFWYADMYAPPVTNTRRMSEDILSAQSRPFDSEGRPRHPIHPNLHPNQLQPNLPFCQFVFSVLHSTQVSFSVTILALMYTYKYKKIQAMGRRPPYHTEVSEAQGFVTGLMLANKYLDDNTYTNTTWAQFLGLPVKEVNDYELDWLDALEFNLCIRTEEFEAWRSMLDAHVRCRERGDSATLNGFVYPQNSRARSASPPMGYYSPPGSDQLRKRSAKDAFSSDVLHNAAMYEAARLGARKSSFVPMMGFNGALPTPAPSVSPSNPSLARSVSLNRQIARLPNGRRDSLSADQMPQPQADLRHAALVNQWGYMEPMHFNKDERWRIPVQPRLYFLQAAATPQFGPDVRYHKAIPHYFDAGYGSAFDPDPYGPGAMDMDHGVVDMPDPNYIMYHQDQVSHFVNPQPAPFANAGPPGYAYGWQMPQPPQQQPNQLWARHQWKPGHASRWSAGSDEALMHVRPAPMCHPASEWSTPAQPVHAGF